MNEFRCQYCDNACGVVIDDNSFDHEFGTEESYCFVSDCCGMSIVDEYGEEVPQSELEEIWECI